MNGRLRQRLGPTLLSAWLTLSMAGIPSTLLAAEPAFQIRNASTGLQDDVYRLDADIEYSLPPEPLEALENGVPIVFELVIRVVRQRRWLPNETVATLLQQHRLKYHALTELYLVTNLNSGERSSYPTRRSALREMGKVRGLPVIDMSLLQPGQNYQVELMARLDIESLPAPLRLLAYLSGDWWSSSKWQNWQL